MYTLDKLDTFTRSYLTTALWSSTDDDGTPLEQNFGLGDLSPEVIQEAAEDCADFQQANAELLEKAYEQRESYDNSSAGHDFWLTRNRHGAGFWDRGLGETGKALTDAAHVYGEANLDAGDDGMIYGH